MNNNFPDAVADLSNKPTNDLTIQEARRMCTALGITSQRDWTLDDFRAAIDNKRKGNKIVEVVVDTSTNPPPGHARIKLHNNSAGQNIPVPVALNRYIVKIPRDVIVDVPLELLENLRHSTNPSISSKTDPQTGETIKETRYDPAYPFDLYGITPGIAKYANGVQKIKGSSDPERYGLRVLYKATFGRWPKREEFKEFKKHHDAVKAGFSAKMTDDEKAALLLKHMTQQQNA